MAIKPKNSRSKEKQSKINLRFATLFIISMAIVSLTPILIIGAFWVSKEYSRFNYESKNLKDTFIESQKSLIKAEVDRAIAYIDFKRSQAEDRLKISVKNRVNEAYSIVSHIYEINKDKKSDREIQEQIKEALRSIRFNQGRGYYFITVLDGTEILYPVAPQFEDVNLLDLQDEKGAYVIQDEIRVIKDKGEGFLTAYWRKPGIGDEMIYPKITYVKYFEPYDWSIGTGEYLDDVTRDIQDEILNRLTRIRFGKSGYIFVNRYNGDALITDGQRVTEPQNLWELSDPNGVKVIQEEYKAAVKPDGDFIFYMWNKMGETEPKQKVSFIGGIQDWEWIIGAGVYIDEIDEIIAAMKAQLIHNVRVTLTGIFIIVGFLCILIFFITFYFSNRIKRELDIFISFFNRLATRNVKISLSEFSIRDFKTLAHSANDMVEEKRKIEASLRDSEEKFRSLAENLISAIFTIDQKGYFTYVNPAAQEILEYSEEDLKTLRLNRIIHPKYRRLVRSRGLQRLRGRKCERTYEFMVVTKTGKEKWVEISDARVVLNGQPIIIGTAIDISKRKKAETALMESNERLSRLIHTIPDIVCFKDIELCNIVINEAFEQFVGKSHDEIIGKTDRELFPPGLADESVKSDMDLLNTGQTKISEERYEMPDGTKRYFETIKAPYYDENNNIAGLVGVSRDVTDRKYIAEELQRAQKLESIGALAGGLAHNFNNRLAAIMGNAQLAMLNYEAGKDITKYIKNIENESEQATNLTQQLLTFSKGGAPIKKTASIVEVLEEALKFALSGSNVNYRLSIQKNIPPVEIDKGQMYQAIDNIVINADQAMPDGGTLDVKVEKVFVADKDSLPLQKGNYIVLIIKDYGVGILPVYQQKIFDPYFTTKTNSNGLGLTAAYSIVKNHGGTITVESEQGRGTTCYVYIPASDKTAPETSATDITAVKGHGKILIMDDEKMIRNLIKDMLTSFGYEVGATSDGKAAIEAYRREQDKGEPFDVVVLDLTIPGGMGGKATIFELKKLDPNVKAIVASGYFNDPVMANHEQYGFTGVLAKPYRLQELQNMLEKLIELS